MLLGLERRGEKVLATLDEVLKLKVNYVLAWGALMTGQRDLTVKQIATRAARRCCCHEV
jgi:hypothetical protein